MYIRSSHFELHRNSASEHPIVMSIHIVISSVAFDTTIGRPVLFHPIVLGGLVVAAGAAARAVIGGASATGLATLFTSLDGVDFALGELCVRSGQILRGTSLECLEAKWWERTRPDLQNARQKCEKCVV